MSDNFIDIGLADWEDARRIAALRHAESSGTMRFRSDNDEIGAVGERAFSRFTGLPMTESTPEGDEGIDFRITERGHEVTINTKTTPRRPHFHLLVPCEREIADIMALLAVDDADVVWACGWEFGREIRKAPHKDWGDYGLECYYISVYKLRPAKMLLDWIADRQLREVFVGAT